MNTRTSMRSCAVRLIPCAVAMAAATHLAVAGVDPNGNFTHGTGSINHNPATNVFTITASDGSIIEYNHFNIGDTQTVNFIQPGASARVLNRVMSNDPSLIDGALNANGIVYLVNPAGIIVGDGAVINTAAFYAIGGEMKNSDFLKRLDKFTNLGGNVINYGTIRAEDAIHLVGQRIVNHGEIDVTGFGGIVTLTASDHAVQISGPSRKYMVTINNAPGGPFLGGAGVNHTDTGTITTADGGRIRLGAGDVFSMAIQVAGTGIDGSYVNFDSDAHIDGNATIHGDTFFASTVDTARTSAPATLQIVGDASFDGGVGTTRLLESLEVIGDTTMDAGLVFTNGDQDFRGRMTLLSDTKLASFASGDISISGEADGPHALFIETDGTMFLLSAVGSNAPLEELIMVGNGKAVLSGKTITTINDQRYLVDVELADHMHMLSSDGKIQLSKTVNGASYDLTLDAPDSHIQGEVYDVNLLTTRGGTTHIGADISVLDGMRFENAVKLTDSVTLSNSGGGDIAFLGTVDGEHALVVTTNNGDVRFNGNVGENDPLASLETIVNGTIFFGANLVQTVGDILLNEQVNLIAVPAIATIGAEGQITFVTANGDFVMGHKQKLTALGDIMIDAANGTATLGDLHAFGDMFVNANAILLLARDAADVMQPDGTMIMDAGLDFVATGSFNFSVAPVVIGSGPDPRFVSLLANADVMGTLGAFEVLQSEEALPESRFRLLPETFLDPFVASVQGPGGPDGPGPGPNGPGPGEPGGPGNGGPQPPSNGTPIEEADLATALSGTMDDVDELEFEDSLNIDPTERTGLAIMGVHVREVSRDAETGYVDGRAVYNDLQTPSINGNGDAIQQPIVSINRIHRGQLRNTLRHLDQTLLVLTFDPETDKLASVQHRDEAIADALATSWDRFRQASGHGTNADFAASVREHDAELARVFAALQELPSELAAMGLSTHEADQALRSVLKRLSDGIDGLHVNDLAEIVRRSPWQPI